MTNLNWTASESQRVEPFRTAPLALDLTQFRLKDDDDFKPQGLQVIESEDAWKAIEPEIAIALDIGNATEESGIPEEELSVALVIRDRVLNNFQLLGRWDAVNVPISPIPIMGHLKHFSHSKSLDVCTYLIPSTTKKRDEGIASTEGDVLARKIFKVRVYEQKTKFPKRWATPDEFEAKGLPRDTGFCVNWIDHDLKEHPRDTFEVWLNEQYRDQIASFQVGGKAGNLLERYLAASILTELATAVFGADKQELNEPFGMIGIITDELKEISGKSFEEMRQLFSVGHDGHSLVRAWVHEKLRANASLQRLDFLGKQK